ncbi:S-adenosyl-L-methionine-dependent methyltransferase [Nemania serpens]|nr:S-adenosyl-L-methionine-dependent methyltransferase [Nemania serpens]
MSTTESIYILNAGSAQTEHDRLNTQHHIFTEIMQNHLLPPHIASSLSASPTPPKIIEIATGTAVWLSETAKTLPPDSELVGLDFDTSKFPSPSSLAPNITLRQANMYEPFPGDLFGRFDVVHMRLITFALKEGYAVDLAKNLMTLLKPGGHLLFSCVEPPSLAWFKFQDLNYRFGKKVGRDLGIPIAMKYYMQQAGFVDCDDKAYPGASQLYTHDPKEWISRMNEHSKMFVAQTIRGIVSLGGVEGMTTEQEADELIALLHEELPGRKLSHLFVRAWGKKPTAD